VRPPPTKFSFVKYSGQSSAPSDETFVNAVAEHIRACARTGMSGHMYIETAGGENHS